MRHLLLLPIILTFLFQETAKAQKPKVQVSFHVTSGTPFYSKFSNDIGEIEASGLDTLIKGLNQYIGFADFIKEAAAYQLSIELNTKFINSTSSIKVYMLIFNLTDGHGLSANHQWQFLSFSQFVALSTSSDVLDQLGNSWIGYLEGHYNEDLVQKMFNKLSLTIPNGDHYFVDASQNVYEAILPFKLEDLQLDTVVTTFTVTVNGTLTDGTPRNEVKKPTYYSGVVPISVSQFPANLKGCMRINLGQLASMRLLGGKVNIIQYGRREYLKTINPNDFLNDL